MQGLVPPETLGFHVRDSIRRGHAVRIGHGTAIMHEDDPVALLREMAAKRILVEVALTSADLILDVKGTAHPLAIFLQRGVPVALATDDLGVSRSSHTREWVKAVQEQRLDYPTMKRLAQNSIEYAFADEATKTRLKQELAGAFRQFEQRQASATPGASRAAAP